MDSVGVNSLAPALSSSFAVSLVFFTATCVGGGCMRVFVAPDAAFMDTPVYDPDSAITAPTANQASWRHRCRRGVSFLGKLGP